MARPKKKQNVPQEMNSLDAALVLKTAKVYNDYDINLLVPADYNPREEVEPGTRLWNELEASLRQFGFADPVVINSDNTIIGGHQRVTVAKALGWKSCCVSMVDLDKNREKALNIALNKITGNWKEMQLGELLRQIKGQIPPEAIGYNEKEMERALNKASSNVGVEDDFDIDAALEQPTFAKLGDLWCCGPHRIVCGDSRDPVVYEKLMDGARANLLLTDPPYLVAYESEVTGKIKNDALNDKDGYDFLLNCFQRFKENLAEISSAYIFYATAKSRVFHDAFEDAGFRVFCGLVWRKNKMVMSRGDYNHNFEPIIYGCLKDGHHEWYGDQKQLTCFDFNTINKSGVEGFGHPTSKPVPLMAYLIKQSSLENGIVLDGFHGSGSTMVACHQLNRRAFAVELDPHFVSLEVLRYIYSCNEDKDDGVYCIREGQKLTFEEAVLEAGVHIIHDENNGGRLNVVA